MSWSDKGIIVNKFLYKENDIILHVFTENHGLQSALFYGSNSKKNLEKSSIANYINVEFVNNKGGRSGYFKIETIKNFGGFSIDNILKSSILLLKCHLIYKLMANSEDQNKLFNSTLLKLNTLITINQKSQIISNYIMWELDLLESIGYGVYLNLSNIDNLHYISPRTGASVSKETGGPWHDRLFIITDLMKNNQYKDRQDLLDTIKISSHFLKRALIDLGNNHEIPSLRNNIIKYV